ncbi:TMEM175 family protein [Arthrobacter sp. JSM 101049]|uniref:TMEM175 family protein n=1 Tax=Arthrobacter sp. JSM 101049 TaxID=929097 RepID=UPI003567ADF2
MRSKHPLSGPPREMYGIGRVEAFSDGVIAVAITLLVLDLRVPEPSDGGSLAHRLLELWPNYLAYAISFLAIGIMWINHHAALRRLKSVDHTLLVVNLLLLLCIVALPFSTSLFATYLDVEPGGHLAAVVYAGSFLVTSVVFLGLQFLIIVRKPHLLRVPLTRGRQRSLLLRGAVAVPTYLVAALLGLLTPLLTLAVCIVLGVFYFIPFRPTGPSMPEPAEDAGLDDS